jgi:Zn-dependent protease
MLDFPLEKVREAVVSLIALILSITVHEFGHALAADRLGDRLPRSQGRVTLNPLAHIDPIGTIIMPLVIFFTGIPLIGWGKPVMVNPVSFSRRFRMKTSHLMVAAAGPAMNVLLALIVTLILSLTLRLGILSPNNPIASGIAGAIFLNWALAFFNLVPCPPLDGGTILRGILPDRFEPIFRFLDQYGFFVVMGLVITGAISIFLIPADYLWRLTFELIL